MTTTKPKYSPEAKIFLDTLKKINSLSETITYEAVFSLSDDEKHGLLTEIEKAKETLESRFDFLNHIIHD